MLEIDSLIEGCKDLDEIGRRLDEAADRPNTIEAMNRAKASFEKLMKKSLPCSTQDLLDYLAIVATKHAYATVSTRCYLISSWHRRAGYPSPVDDNVARRLKGIRSKYAKRQKQARPLLKEDVESIVLSLEQELWKDVPGEHPKRARARRLRAVRDKAFILIGFWFALRSDNIVRLKRSDIMFETGPNAEDVLSLRLSQTKTSAGDQEKRLPALPYLCPLAAVRDWIDHAWLGRKEDGYLFTSINQWGHISDAPINVDSVVRMLRSMLAMAGFDPTSYTSHSLRRGFATWATYEKSSLKDLMSWVGWSDVGSALRYQDAREALPFELMTNESSMAQALEVLRGKVQSAYDAAQITRVERNELLGALNDIASLDAEHERRSILMQPTRRPPRAALAHDRQELEFFSQE